MRNSLGLLVLLGRPYQWVARKFGGASAAVLLLGLGLFIGTLFFAIFGATPFRPV